jgi:hypothetical protein
MRAALRSSSAPSWVLRGAGRPATIDLDFVNNRYWVQPPSLERYFLDGNTGIGVRNSDGYATTQSGLLVPFGTNVARVTNLGFLSENAGTNVLRNNTMQGAVPGSPGTVPTNWAIVAPGGLTRTIVGVGKENGVDYIDIRVNGTTSSGNQLLSIYPEISTSLIASVQNDIWTMSAYARLAGGTLANVIEAGYYLGEFDGSGNLVANYGAYYAVPLSSTRVSFTQTVIDAATAFVRPIYWVYVSGSSPVDMTFRFGWPQFELKDFASSPIPTTSAAITRAADQCEASYLTLQDGELKFGKGYSAFVKTTTPPSPSAYPSLIQLSASTDAADNRIMVYQNTDGTMYTLVNNVDQANLGVVLPNTRIKVAVSSVAGRQASTLNGGTIATTAQPQPSEIDLLYLGNQGGGAPWDDYIDRIAIWHDTVIPDRELRFLTGASGP